LRKDNFMASLRKRSLIAAAFFGVLCAVPAQATEPPADRCALLPAADVSKTLGQAFDSPEKSVAPRPFANTASGTDCHYHSKSGGNLMFRAYADPSPAVAADLFAKLHRFFGTGTPVKDLGDEAYFDEQHGLHIRKGKVRYFLGLDAPGDFTPAREKQLKDLATAVAARL
jgi:hypothetical protein